MVVTNLFAQNPFEDDADLVAKTLVRRFACLEHPAGNPRDIVDEIRRFPQKLRPAFLRFWETGEYDPRLRAGGVTVYEIVTRGRYLPVVAYCVLCDIMQDPKDEVRRLRRRIRDIESPLPMGSTGLCSYKFGAPTPHINVIRGWDGEPLEL